VDDRNSMPYIVGTLQSSKVHNFGFSGYGPHQMLAAINNGMIHCKPKLVIYQANLGHVGRSAGYSSWDKHGPKYVLQNGRLIYKGHFDDGESVIKKKIVADLKKSNFLRIYIFKQDRHKITDYDIQLFLEIVNASRRKLVEKFPEVEFHVILWDKKPDDKTYLKIKNGFESLSIKYHLVSDMLPDYFENIEKYQISTYDRHPNPLAHQLIAEYVVNNIIGMKNLHKSN
jgi:hypothetical protein